MAQLVSIPKGTRDFSPLEMNRRNYIFDTIKDVFRKFGYMQIETPAMENLSTLLGKYGEEGDKLLFRILNSGDFKHGISSHTFENSEPAALSGKICEKGLRYDLTVPFARYVVQHLSEITFPFKRYQIQPVWRADRPQKGRYREFYQCDADVVGSKSLLNEAELVNMIDTVFTKLNISVTIKINNRKILAGIAEQIGAPDKIVDITVAIDKLDKIGLENVNKELLEKGIANESVQKLQPILQLSGSTSQKLEQLRGVLATSTIGIEGIDEAATLFGYINNMTLLCNVQLDLTLARGLNYYTGAIFEVKANDVQIGSISGGGRYDNLTGIFGLKDVSGVGISFGADRIYDVMEQLNIFPSEAVETTKVLFVNFGDAEVDYLFPLLNQVRTAGINAEIYPDNAKMKKQFTYADKKGITYVVIAGQDEMVKNVINIKNMVSGEQIEIAKTEILKAIV